MEVTGKTLVVSLCLLSLKGVSGSADCYLPDPDQDYLLTNNAEGRYQYYGPQWAERTTGSRNFRFRPRQGKRGEPECEYQSPIECDSSAKYRTFDGSCNNLQYPYWGKAETPLARFLKPDYDDGIGSPRLHGKYWRTLPNPRYICLRVHTRSLPHDELRGYSHFLMLWGQRCSHDMIEKVEPKSANGRRMDCCEDNRGEENCEMPITLSPKDPYYGPYGRTCLNFVRSKASPNLKCSYEIREQTSEFTSFLDVSDVYGSNLETSDKLRTKVDGLLKTQYHPDGSELMPGRPGGFCRSTNNKQCFVTGDPRANQQPGLMSVHVILLREHNRIARKLKEINSDLDDEQLFQEARRIVIAQAQHITYSSYLPRILGPDIVHRFDLSPRPLYEYFTGYNEYVIPTIRNSFMAAAFRFGHSMINDYLGFTSASGSKERVLFRNLWVNPDRIYDTEGVEKVLRGLQAEHSQRVDRFKTEEVSNRFFENPAKLGFGNDLISTNIYRGRDHGIVGYLAWRKMCNLPAYRSFYSLTNHCPRTIALLSRVYRSVEDIDLFVGGVTERPLPGALVGPTFACILGLQFKALKYGDRFYYENDEAHVKFTPEQLNEIKKATLARIICRNSNIGRIQEDVFAYGTPEVDCYNIQDDIDFRHWVPQN